MSKASKRKSGTFEPDVEESAEHTVGGPSQALAGPFTLREVVFGAGVVLVFIGTLLPFIGDVLGFVNFWNTVPLFYIGIGILAPVAACALLAARRMGSSGLRVGSLSVDQFASVSAVLAATFFFLETVTLFGPGPLVALLGSLALLAATVVGPLLPVIRNDFLDRPEVPAHRLARPITPARPRPAKPVSRGSSTEPAMDASPDFFSTSSPVTGSRAIVFGERSAEDGVNPAAAVMRQNGAGLYGAAGAGVVGAGAAAAGQSGLDPDAADEPEVAARSTTTMRASDGSHMVERRPDGDDTAPTPDDSSDDDYAAAPDRGASDSGASSAEAAAASVEETGMPAVVEETTADMRHDAAGEPRERRETITATRPVQEEQPVVEAFWFAVGSPRPVVDEQTGQQIFTLEPGDWEVGIEDRGSEFLVQDKRTGMVGILQDLRNIERAPRD